jgi:CRISPR/Cas system endoribonuclease Cas6 (RAMP superfamily)
MYSPYVGIGIVAVIFPSQNGLIVHAQQQEDFMQNLYTTVSLATLPILFIHAVLLMHCAIRFADYILLNKHINCINQD